MGDYTWQDTYDTEIALRRQSIESFKYLEHEIMPRLWGALVHDPFEDLTHEQKYNYTRFLQRRVQDLEYLLSRIVNPPVDKPDGM